VETESQCDLPGDNSPTQSIANQAKYLNSRGKRVQEKNEKKNGEVMHNDQRDQHWAWEVGEEGLLNGGQDCQN